MMPRIERLMLRAEDGDIEIQYTLAKAYYTGEKQYEKDDSGNDTLCWFKVWKDLEKARGWCQPAATGGHKEARYLL